MSKLKTETFADYKKRNSRKYKRQFAKLGIEGTQAEALIFLCYLHFLPAYPESKFRILIDETEKQTLMRFFIIISALFNEFDLRFMNEQLNLMKVETLRILFNTTVSLFESMVEAKQFEAKEKIRLANQLIEAEDKLNQVTKGTTKYYPEWERLTLNEQRKQDFYDTFKQGKPELQLLPFKKFSDRFRQWKHEKKQV